MKHDVYALLRPVKACFWLMVHGDGCISDLSVYFSVCALKGPWPTENKMLFLVADSREQLLSHKSIIQSPLLN